jgi:hypothetical protein
MVVFIVFAVMLAIVFIVIVTSSKPFATGAFAQLQEHEQRVRDALQLDEFASGDGRAIGVSCARKAVAVLESSGTGSWVPFARIAAVEIAREYETHESSYAQTQTSRGSQALGAAVGAAVAGPAGLVVGGLSSKSTTVSYGSSYQRLSVVHLKLRLYSEDTPFLSVPVHGEEAVERIAARVQNEIEQRGPAVPTSEEMRLPFERMQVPDLVTPLLERPQPGWWQRTFG